MCLNVYVYDVLLIWRGNSLAVLIARKIYLLFIFGSKWLMTYGSGFEYTSSMYLHMGSNPVGLLVINLFVVDNKR